VVIKSLASFFLNALCRSGDGTVFEVITAHKQSEVKAHCSAGGGPACP
jgi:hypothetical protein